MIFDPFLTPLRINTGGRKVSNHVASIVKLRIGEKLILKAKLLVLDLCDELVFPPRSNITDFRSIANKYVLIMLFLYPVNFHASDYFFVLPGCFLRSYPLEVKACFITQGRRDSWL